MFLLDEHYYSANKKHTDYHLPIIIKIANGIIKTLYPSSHR